MLDFSDGNLMDLSRNIDEKILAEFEILDSYNFYLAGAVVFDVN